MDQPFVVALNELMTGSGISNNELARRIDVDPAQIGRWRKGRGRPRPENLVRAAAVFGVDHAWLWSLAYPEGIPTSEGPEAPRLAAFLADVRKGWLATDEGIRDFAERTTRAIWTVQPTLGPANSHHEGTTKRLEQTHAKLAKTPRQPGHNGSDGPLTKPYVDAGRFLTRRRPTLAGAQPF